MKKHRIFIENIKDFPRLTQQEINHLIVRRAKIGDKVTLIDGGNQELEVLITKIDGFNFEFSNQSTKTNDLELPQPVTVAFSLIKNNEEMIIRVCTELGAAIFQPIISERSQIRAISDQKLFRWQKIAIEATKQCTRSVIPEIKTPININEIPQVEFGLVAIPGCIKKVSIDWRNPLWLLTGPEGGLTEKEINFVIERGFCGIGLGKRILRAETAAIALLTSIGAALNL